MDEDMDQVEVDVARLNEYYFGAQKPSKRAPPTTHLYVDSIEKYSSTKKKDVAPGLMAGNVNVMGVKKHRAQREKEEQLKHSG